MRTVTRTSIFTLLILTVVLPFAGADESLTLQKARSLTLSRSATLRQAGLVKVRNGMTTIEEVGRVTRAD